MYELAMGLSYRRAGAGPWGRMGRLGTMLFSPKGVLPGMPAVKESGTPLAAPGVGELLTPPGQILTGPRSIRRRRDRVFSHFELEFDLARRPATAAGAPLLERLARRLKEHGIVEPGSLAHLAAATLHALASQGFRRVDHWEVRPGGWLPLPAPVHAPATEEPVGELLDLLESGAWSEIGSARSFSARLSDGTGGRADVVVRRVHRLRHAITLKVRGTWSRERVDDLRGAIDERLPVAHAAMRRYGYV
jgi:hypothetical protein